MPNKRWLPIVVTEEIVAEKEPYFLMGIRTFIISTYLFKGISLPNRIFCNLFLKSTKIMTLLLGRQYIEDIVEVTPKDRTVDRRVSEFQKFCKGEKLIRIYRLK